MLITTSLKIVAVAAYSVQMNLQLLVFETSTPAFGGFVRLEGSHRIIVGFIIAIELPQGHFLAPCPIRRSPRKFAIAAAPVRFQIPCLQIVTIMSVRNLHFLGSVIQTLVHCWGLMTGQASRHQIGFVGHYQILLPDRILEQAASMRVHDFTLVINNYKSFS